MLETKGIVTKVGNKLSYVSPVTGEEIKEFRKAWTNEKLQVIIDEWEQNPIAQKEVIEDVDPDDLEPNVEEYADEYFEGPMNEYMQFVAKAKHDYSSVTHVDGTARVQVVKKDCRSVIRYILEEWYSETGCPMLLNTSLNIKGMPMVDTWEDAENFMREYNVKVF